MPSILNAWESSPLALRIGVITASTVAVGGVAYGIYKLQSEKAKSTRPPRASTPVRRVDPFETAQSVPKTPPKTPPKPKLPFSKTKENEPTTELNLSEKENLPKTPPSSPVTDEPASLTSSTLASFEPISLSQVSMGPEHAEMVSLPSLHVSPPGQADGVESLSPSFVKINMPEKAEVMSSPERTPEINVEHQSMTAESPRHDESQSMSFVQIEDPKEEEMIKVEESSQAFSAPPPPPAPVKEVISADAVEKDVDVKEAEAREREDDARGKEKEDESGKKKAVDTGEEQEEDAEGREDRGIRECSVEQQLEEDLTLRGMRDDDEMSRDGTTMATIGSDTERTIGDEEDEEDEESNVEQRGSDNEDDIPDVRSEGSHDSGDSDIQKLEDEPEEESQQQIQQQPPPSQPQSSSDTEPQGPTSTEAESSRLKEKDENDIVVISKGNEESVAGGGDHN